MKNKKIIAFVSVIFVIFVIFAVCLGTVVIKSNLNETTAADNDASTDNTEQGAAGSDTEQNAADDHTKQDPADDNTQTASVTSGAEAAEGLIGQTLTREEIEGTLGECEKFYLTDEGCDRGVHAGRFYYDGYAIFSRTYDKGQTFSIVSVNE